MPTADHVTGSRSSDVFRTVGGVDLNIGPLDRLRGRPVAGSGDASLMSITPASCPRIILKDSLGYELDTYTTLQEAIYRAKWNVRSTGQAKTPLEWRLPKAPPPARPDLTRTCPPVKHPQLSQGYSKTYGGYTNVLEIDVDDVSFVRESLDHLPFAPSLSFLRQEILMGPKTYFQIVGTMLLHKKLLSETEKRQAIYNFPGFCTGCVRMGLCYGCERSTEPHYHEDKLVKTGGGFTYYKKDRPEKEMKHKHPLNWRINQPDQVLKKLMEDYAGLHLEGEVTEKVKEHLDEAGVDRDDRVSDEDLMDTDRLNKQYNRGDDGRFLPDIDPRYISEQHRDATGLSQLATPGVRGQGHGRGHSDDRSIDPSEVEIELWEDGRRKQLPRMSAHARLDQSADRSRDGMSRLSAADPNYLRSRGNSGSRDDSGSRYNDYDRYEHRLPKYRRTETDDETEDDEKRRDYEGDDEGRGRTKERLYRPPPAFKLKKSPKRRVEAKSPFSTDRSYDIQKGRDFVPKKSGKKPTEFVDFRNVDVSWKEPKKFELKKAKQKPTKFWSGQRNKKKEKSRSRSPRARRPPSPRSVSPDSGLDTGFMTAIVRVKSPSKTNTKAPAKIDKKTETNELPIKTKKQRRKRDRSSPHHPGYRNPLDEVNDTAAEFYKLITELTDDEIVRDVNKQGVNNGRTVDTADEGDMTTDKSQPRKILNETEGKNGNSRRKNLEENPNASGTEKPNRQKGLEAEQPGHLSSRLDKENGNRTRFPSVSDRKKSIRHYPRRRSISPYTKERMKLPTIPTIRKINEKIPNFSNTQKSPIHLPSIERPLEPVNTLTQSDYDNSIIYKQDKPSTRGSPHEEMSFAIVNEGKRVTDDIQSEKYNGLSSSGSTGSPDSDPLSRNIKSYKDKEKEPNEPPYSSDVVQHDRITNNHSRNYFKHKPSRRQRITRNTTEPEHVTETNTERRTHPEILHGYLTPSDSEYDSTQMTKFTRDAQITPKKLTFSDSEYENVPIPKTTSCVPSTSTPIIPNEPMTMSDSECVIEPLIQNTREKHSISQSQNEAMTSSDSEYIVPVKVKKTQSSRLATHRSRKKTLSTHKTMPLRNGKSSYGISTKAKQILEGPMFGSEHGILPEIQNKQGILNLTTDTPTKYVKLLDSDSLTMIDKNRNIPSKYTANKQKEDVNNSEVETTKGSPRSSPNTSMTLTDSEYEVQVKDRSIRCVSKTVVQVTPTENFTLSDSKQVIISANRSISSSCELNSPKESFALQSKGKEDIGVPSSSFEQSLFQRDTLTHSLKESDDNTLEKLSKNNESFEDNVNNISKSTYDEYLEPPNLQELSMIQISNARLADACVDDKTTDTQRRNKKSKSIRSKRSNNPQDIKESDAFPNSKFRSWRKDANADQLHGHKMSEDAHIRNMDLADTPTRTVYPESVLSAHSRYDPHVLFDEQACSGVNKTYTNSFGYNTSTIEEDSLVRSNDMLSMTQSQECDESSDLEARRNGENSVVASYTEDDIQKTIKMTHINEQVDSGVFVSHGESKLSFADETDDDKHSFQNGKRTKRHSLSAVTKPGTSSEFMCSRMSTIECIVSADTDGKGMHELNRSSLDNPGLESLQEYTTPSTGTKAITAQDYHAHNSNHNKELPGVVQRKQKKGKGHKQTPLSNKNDQVEMKRRGKNETLDKHKVYPIEVSDAELVSQQEIKRYANLDSLYNPENESYINRKNKRRRNRNKAQHIKKNSYLTESKPNGNYQKSDERLDIDKSVIEMKICEQCIPEIAVTDKSRLEKKNKEIEDSRPLCKVDFTSPNKETVHLGNSKDDRHRMSNAENTIPGKQNIGSHKQRKRKSDNVKSLKNIGTNLLENKPVDNVMYQYVDRKRATNHEEPQNGQFEANRPCNVYETGGNVDYKRKTEDSEICPRYSKDSYDPSINKETNGYITDHDEYIDPEFTTILSNSIDEKLPLMPDDKECRTDEDGCDLPLEYHSSQDDTMVDTNEDDATCDEDDYDLTHKYQDVTKFDPNKEEGINDEDDYDLSHEYLSNEDDDMVDTNDGDDTFDEYGIDSYGDCNDDQLHQTVKYNGREREDDYADDGDVSDASYEENDDEINITENEIHLNGDSLEAHITHDNPNLEEGASVKNHMQLRQNKQYYGNKTRDDVDSSSVAGEKDCVIQPMNVSHDHSIHPNISYPNRPVSETSPNITYHDSSSDTDIEASDSFGNEQGSADSDTLSDFSNEHVSEDSDTISDLQFSFHSEEIDGLSKTEQYLQPISDQNDMSSRSERVRTPKWARSYNDPRIRMSHLQANDDTSDTDSDIHDDNTERWHENQRQIAGQQDDQGRLNSADEYINSKKTPPSYKRNRGRRRKNVDIGCNRDRHDVSYDEEGGNDIHRIQTHHQYDNPESEESLDDNGYPQLTNSPQLYEGRRRKPRKIIKRDGRADMSEDTTVAHKNVKKPSREQHANLESDETSSENEYVQPESMHHQHKPNRGKQERTVSKHGDIQSKRMSHKSVKADIKGGDHASKEESYPNEEIDNDVIKSGDDVSFTDTEEGMRFGNLQTHDARGNNERGMVKMKTHPESGVVARRGRYKYRTHETPKNGTVDMGRERVSHSKDRTLSDFHEKQGRLIDIDKSNSSARNFPDESHLMYERSVSDHYNNDASVEKVHADHDVDSASESELERINNRTKRQSDKNQHGGLMRNKSMSDHDARPSDSQQGRGDVSHGTADQIINKDKLPRNKHRQAKDLDMTKSKQFDEIGNDLGNKKDKLVKHGHTNIIPKTLQHDDENVFLRRNETVSPSSHMQSHSRTKGGASMHLDNKRDDAIKPSVSINEIRHSKKDQDHSSQKEKDTGVNTPFSDRAELNGENTQSEIQLDESKIEQHQKGRLHPSHSIRSISIDMSTLSPHLHMYESSTPSESTDDDQQGHNGRTTDDDIHNYRYRRFKGGSSPPVIDNNIAFDGTSLTSQEPDLELVFDDVIDVENLEINNEEEEELQNLKQKEERRRRRHRHRKKKKLELTSREEVEACLDDGGAEGNKRGTVDSATLKGRGENMEGNIGNRGNSENEIEGFVDDDEDFFKAVQMINDETKEFNQPSFKTGIRSTKRPSHCKRSDKLKGNAEKINSEQSTHYGPKRKDRKSKDKPIDKAQETPLQIKRTNERQKKHNVDVNLETSEYGQLEDREENTAFNPSGSGEKLISHLEKNSSLKDPSNNETNKIDTGIDAGKQHTFPSTSPVLNEEDPHFQDELIVGSDGETYFTSEKPALHAGEERPMDKKRRGKRYEKQHGNHESSYFPHNFAEAVKADAERDELAKRFAEFGFKKDEDPRRTQKKGRRNKKKRASLEIDFTNLPSIQSQISKIMDGYNYDDAANTQSSRSLGSRSRGSRMSNRRHSMSTSGSDVCRLFRSRSEQKGRTIGEPDARQKRSQSLPHAADLMNMKESWDTEDDEELKQPVTVPVYMGAFPRGIAKKQFKKDRKRVKGRDRPSTGSYMEEDGTNKSELEPLREESQVIEPAEMDRVLTPSLTRIPTPASTNSLLSNGNYSNSNSNQGNLVPNPLSTLGEGHTSSINEDAHRLSNNNQIREDKPRTPVKREIVKKEKKPKNPVPVRPKSITPEPEPIPASPTPEPIEDEEPVSRDISFVFNRDLPELPPIEVPDLPDVPEAQKTEYKGPKREKKLIEVTPELPVQKQKFPQPPKRRPLVKTRVPSRKSKVAEAPVTTQELQQMVDPLDFLAKYCIINPDRLPFYERVFNGALSVQTPRYSRANEAPKGAIVHLPPAQLSDHELNMLKDITVLNQGHCPRNDGLSAPEQYLEKLNYSIEFTKSKQDIIQRHMEKIQAEKMSYMASMAKLWDRDIARLDYKTKSKKKKKKKKKKKGEEPDYDQMGAMNEKTNFQPMKASDITDEVIVSRMDDKMMKKIKKDPTYLKCKMELGRDIEKLKHYDQRIAQIEDEKDLVGLYCMDYYFSEQGTMSRPHEFRRQQSRLYQKLHPDTDVEMNIEEVEPALQQINNKLLTEREFQYIYFILDLPKREKINFRLFTIIAALSEKVTQMDPMIRKLINKVDYNALDVKLEKSKELFQLLQDEHVLPQGKAPSDNLAVELTAGGLTPEHTNYVMNKFDREGRGFIDFLDFVTYIPLFIDIHQRIVEDPFNQTLCV